MIVLIDVNYLANRAHYATKGALSWHGVQTGVAFGIFNDLLQLHAMYRPSACMMCFDSHPLYRSAAMPNYKANRKPQTAQEAETKQHIRDQIRAMYETHLPALGLTCVKLPGLEADDLLAYYAKHITEECVIVSNDHDLYQCLCDRVRIHRPGKGAYTVNDFINEFGVLPCQWSWVKAIAGCSSDNVDGVPGVGVKTACRYVQGVLTGSRLEKIRKNWDLVVTNRGIVSLPLSGDHYRQLTPPTATQIGSEAWDAVCAQLGLISLKGAFK